MEAFPGLPIHQTLLTRKPGGRDGPKPIGTASQHASALHFLLANQDVPIHMSCGVMELPEGEHESVPGLVQIHTELSDA